MIADRMLRVFLTAGAAFLLALLSGPDAGLAYSKKVEKACKGDYKRLCPQYKPASAQMRACMEAKSNEISNVCIQALIDDGEIDRRRAASR